MKIVRSISILTVLLLSNSAFSEVVPSKGYLQYQKSRVNEAMIEMESYGSYINKSSTRSTSIGVNVDSFFEHQTQFERILKDMPDDAKDLRLHIYTPKGFDEGMLSSFISNIAPNFALVMMLDNLSCTNNCNDFEFHIF